MSQRQKSQVDRRLPETKHQETGRDTRFGIIRASTGDDGPRRSQCVDIVYILSMWVKVKIDRYARWFVFTVDRIVVVYRQKYSENDNGRENLGNRSTLQT